VRSRRVAFLGLVMIYLAIVIATAALLAYFLPPLLVVAFGFVTGIVYGIVFLEVLHYIYTGRRIASGWIRQGAKQMWEWRRR
jgi:fatty acid desaturase